MNLDASDFFVDIFFVFVKLVICLAKGGSFMSKIFYVVIALVGVVLAACGSVYEKAPVGIGMEYSELKKSPCACLELKKAPEGVGYFS